MDTCRACLSQRKRMFTIFEPAKSKKIPIYAEMLSSITNLKATENDGKPSKICSGCCKRLEEAYNFKLLVERSDATFTDLSLKRICFNNINDIKLEIHICKVEKVDEPLTDLQQNIKNSNETFYHGTKIQKINVCKPEQKKEITILEFLNNFKEGEDDNMDTECCNDADQNMDPYSSASDADEEYVPPKLKEQTSKNYSKQKKTKEKKKQINKENVHKKKTNVVIKPIYMQDLVCVPTRKERKQKDKSDEKRIRYKKRQLVCPYCGKFVMYLKSHILTHTGEKQFKCDQCPKRFSSVGLLNYHLKTHTGVRPYKCELCVSAFFDAAALKSHMKSHTEERNFVCGLCNKAFKRKNTLARHEMMHNATNKRYQCELCPMTFFTNDNLKHHLRTHTGERPYKCELCSQPYSYRRDFTRHCYKKHGVFLKRRAVSVMNEQVLQRELDIMRELVLRANGLLAEGEPLIPYEAEGSQAAMAYKMAIKALQSKGENIKF